jgi:class 3 adenylate cyclase
MNTFPVAFERMLLDSLADRAVERDVLVTFGRTCSILAMDFSGMTERSTDSIVYALALCADAIRTLRPLIDAHRGEIVTMEADTVFVLFETPRDALDAALAIQRRLRAYNATRTGRINDGTRTDPLYASIGLGHGQVIHVPGHDVYGAEVNHAFVLGEDTARPGEILASTAFLDALGIPPVGVGAFLAADEAVEDTGFAYHVIVDSSS